MHPPELPREPVSDLPPSQEREFAVGGERFRLQEYPIGRDLSRERNISPGLMETGDLDDLMERHRENGLLLTRRLPSRYNGSLPYVFLAQHGERAIGDYTTPVGQNDFRDTDLELSAADFDLAPAMRELREYIQRKKAKVFKVDTVMAALRDLRVRDGRTVMTIGGGRYSDSFFTNGSEGASIALLDEEIRALEKKGVAEGEIDQLRRTAAELQRKYPGARTLRDVVYGHLSQSGGLPAFSEGLYNNSLGVAGMVLTRDNQFVYVDRGDAVSINLGINCTASGAAEFDRDRLSRHGLPKFLGQEMDRETREELGLRGGALLTGAMQERIRLELGLEASDYNLSCVGFIRELPRGGKPEAMFLIRFSGDVNDLVRSVARNEHPERIEVGTVYAQPRDEAFRMLATPGNNRVIQHKGAANLLLAEEYLRNLER